jgi:hypothetical protein
LLCACCLPLLSLSFKSLDSFFFSIVCRPFMEHGCFGVLWWCSAILSSEIWQSQKKLAILCFELVSAFCIRHPVPWILQISALSTPLPCGHLSSPLLSSPLPSSHFSSALLLPLLWSAVTSPLLCYHLFSDLIPFPPLVSVLLFSSLLLFHFFILSPALYPAVTPFLYRCII